MCPLSRYEAMLKKRNIDASFHADYRKWLRGTTESFLTTRWKKNIRVIQKLLGHASLETTMIYIRCVPVRTVKEPKSPLDL